MLIFAKVAGKKPEILLQYEPITNVLQRINLDNKNFFSRAALSNCFRISGRVKDGLKVFLFLETTTKKLNMLPMCNVKVEYKKLVIHKKRNTFSVSHHRTSMATSK